MPSFSESTTILRNLHMLKTLLSIAQRSCQKKGPLSHSLIATADKSINGDASTIPSTEKIISTSRLISLCSKERQILRQSRIGISNRLISAAPRSRNITITYFITKYANFQEKLIILQLLSFTGKLKQSGVTVQPHGTVTGTNINVTGILPERG